MEADDFPFPIQQDSDGFDPQSVPRYIPEFNLETSHGGSHNYTTFQGVAEGSDTETTSLVDDETGKLDSFETSQRVSPLLRRSDDATEQCSTIEKTSLPAPISEYTYLYLLFSALFETYTVGDRVKVTEWLLSDVTLLRKIASYNNLSSDLASVLSGRDKVHGLLGIFARSDPQSSFLVSNISRYYA